MAFRLLMFPVAIAIGLIAGGLFGFFLPQLGKPSAEVPTETDRRDLPAENGAAPASVEQPQTSFSSNGSLSKKIILLDPIRVNLADPRAAWVRLELAIAIDLDESRITDELSATLAQDIVSFIRTVKLSEIATPSGLEHLRGDLVDLARTRSDGRIKGVIIKSILVG